MQHESDDIKYWTFGDSTNHPIFLVHGFTGSHEGFQYLTPELEKYYYIIAPDLPGFGISRPAKQPWTAAHLAQEANEFLASLKLNVKPYLISHSMGGLIAAHMLTQNPELFATKTAFISPVPNKITWRDARKLGALAGRLQYRVGAYLPRVANSKLLSRVATIAMLRTNDAPLRRKIYQHHFDNLDHISSSRYYHAMHVDITTQGVIDFSDQLSLFDTLIVTGTHDNVTPFKYVQRLAQKLNATLVPINGTGHLAHYEHPNKIIQALRDFLR